MAEAVKKEELKKAEETQQEQQAPVDQTAPEGAPQKEEEQKAPGLGQRIWSTVKSGACKVGRGIKKAAPYVGGAIAIGGVAFAGGFVEGLKTKVYVPENEKTPELPDNEEVDEIKVTEIPAEEESQEEAQETETESKEE